MCLTILYYPFIQYIRLRISNSKISLNKLFFLNYIGQKKSIEVRYIFLFKKKKRYIGLNLEKICVGVCLMYAIPDIVGIKKKKNLPN